MASDVDEVGHRPGHYPDEGRDNSQARPESLSRAHRRRDGRRGRGRRSRRGRARILDGVPVEAWRNPHWLRRATRIVHQGPAVGLVRRDLKRRLTLHTRGCLRCCGWLRKRRSDPNEEQRGGQTPSRACDEPLSPDAWSHPLVLDDPSSINDCGPRMNQASPRAQGPGRPSFELENRAGRKFLRKQRGQLG